MDAFAPGLDCRKIRLVRGKAQQPVERCAPAKLPAPQVTVPGPHARFIYRNSQPFLADLDVLGGSTTQSA